MEEICAVCAEVAVWVAYGACGHVQVCAACIARLRFVCDDRRCCICKSLSSFVFVTKALGSLTRVINDFSILPAGAKDGKVGSYWFHEGIQAYFDDFDAYKTVKEMCRLSCTVCEKSEAEGKRRSKRKSKIKNVELLTDHMSRQHELFFCSLCLANKKVFVCEQKLYSRVQLRQHIRNGDSEVDCFGSDRCGFSGHPFCEFCQTPFYGENELYFHMSTEHFTCHICTREHPTQFEYYTDYNDLEIHFRQAHFLCEDDECLDKKFIVFDSEADIKKHAALEHGGNKTRSKSNAATQLPTRFRFRERTDGGYLARTRICGPGISVNQISSNTEGTRSNFLHDVSSSVHRSAGHIGSSDISLTANTMPSSQLQATPLDFRGVLLNGPTFPPLPSTSKRKKPKSKKTPHETGQNTVALPHNLLSLPRSSSHSVGSSTAVNASNSGPEVSPQINPLAVGQSSSMNPSCHLNLTSSGVRAASSASLSSVSMKHADSSSSAFDSVDGGTLGLSSCGERLTKGEDVQAANKSLVDSIHEALKFDPDKFAAFKIISKEYRNGEIEAREYLSCVHQFGLEHLIMDLARLCPDQQKQKELIEISKSRLGGIDETGLLRESDKNDGGKDKGKKKCEESEREIPPNGLVNLLKELKVSATPCRELSSLNEVDHTVKWKSNTPALTEMPKIFSSGSLSKDVANSSAVTKMPVIFPLVSQSEGVDRIPTVTEIPKILPSESQNKDLANTSAVTEMPKILPLGPQSKDVVETQAIIDMPEIVSQHLQSKDGGNSNGGGPNFGQSTAATGGKKRLKKSSKFLKNRLGESSTSTTPNLKHPELPSDLMVVRPNHDSILASIRGVWRNGGGRRLATLTEASPCSR